MTDQLDTEWLVNQIAHALRNPIFAAMVQADAISLRAASDPTLSRPASILTGQLNRLEEVLEEMLRFGRPTRISPRRVAVASLLEEVAAAYGDEARGEEAAVVEVGPVEPDLEAEWDPDAVRIVLERLLDNAVQHTDPPHRASIEVDAADGVISLTVADHGRGIPEDILAKATVPFFPQHRGRPGLGLAVARKFAEVQGGNLEITSRPDEGTTVTVQLPVRVDV